MDNNNTINKDQEIVNNNNLEIIKDQEVNNEDNFDNEDDFDFDLDNNDYYMDVLMSVGLTEDEAERFLEDIGILNCN